MATTLETPPPTTDTNIKSSPSKTNKGNINRQKNLLRDSFPNYSCHISHSLRTNIQFATLCWVAILNGWNDGSTGPLMPRIQKVYHVGYAVVSLIFVFTTVGYIAGCISNIVLTERVGFGKVVSAPLWFSGFRILFPGSMCQVVAYSVAAAGVPFPVLLFAYTINSYGIALQIAQNLGYVLCLRDNKNGARTGLVMGAYGVGALLSPFSATYFAQIRNWSYHFFISLGIAVLNSIFLVAVFRLNHQQACLAEIGITNPKESVSDGNPLRRILKLRDVHLLAVFILFYVGANVTLSGWIVTYIIDFRHGGSSSGYISTGFWAGVAIGRVTLIKVNSLIGESRALLIYILLSIALEFVVWFIPSLTGDAVAIAFIGVLVGPLYPIVANHAGRVVPRALLTGSVGWIVGGGQAGSALIPFITGAIAQKAGIVALHPVVVAVLVTMIALWVMIIRPWSRPAPHASN